MSEQSLFSRRHIEEAATIPAPGLLEQLGLPPEVIRFLRRYRRSIWIAVGLAVLIVTAVSLYGSYRDYRDEKAASALTEAMKAEGAERQELLARVTEQYGSTSAAIWAKVELARLAQVQGEEEKALAALYSVKDSVGKENPVRPLLLYNLGALHENRNEPEKAISAYGELAAFKGFETLAFKAMGRIHEQQGDREQALFMYRQYLAAVEAEDAGQGYDPDRELIEAAIKRLED